MNIEPISINDKNNGGEFNKILIETRLNFYNTLETISAFRKEDSELWKKICFYFNEKFNIDIKDYCHSIEPRYCEYFGDGRFKLKWFINDIGNYVILEINDQETYDQYDSKLWTIHSKMKCYSYLQSKELFEKEVFTKSVDIRRMTTCTPEPKGFDLNQYKDMIVYLSDTLNCIFYVNCYYIKEELTIDGDVIKKEDCFEKIPLYELGYF